MDRSYRRISVSPSPRFPHKYEQRTVEDWYYAEDDRYQPRRVRIRGGLVVEVSTRLD